jgi:hypothetical protein
MQAPRSPVLLYALFVGIPVLCLGGVLLLGRRLPSPVSVGGDWAIDASSMRSDCGTVKASGDKPPRLRISQMGSHVKVRLGDDRMGELRGKVEGSTVDAMSRRGDARVLEMHADVDPEPGHGSMSGRLRVAGCPDAQFSASREQPGQPK